MERLTKVIDNGRIVTTEAEARSYGETDPEDGFFYNYFTGEAVDKLAAYEDTGLEPADIEELLAERDRYKSFFDRITDLPDCNICLKKNRCEFEPRHGEYTRINCAFCLTAPPKEDAHD